MDQVYKYLAEQEQLRLKASSRNKAKRAAWSIVKFVVVPALFMGATALYIFLETK